VVGNLISWSNIRNGANADFFPSQDSLGIRLARVIYVAGGVGAGRAVDRPAIVYLEQVPRS